LQLLCQKLPRDREGFVVRFASGLRIKLKGEQYCRIHKLISRCTPLALWDAMMPGGKTGPSGCQTGIHWNT
jgi:RNA ligase